MKSIGAGLWGRATWGNLWDRVTGQDGETHTSLSCGYRIENSERCSTGRWHAGNQTAARVLWSLLWGRLCPEGSGKEASSDIPRACCPRHKKSTDGLT